MFPSQRLGPRPLNQSPSAVVRYASPLFVGELGVEIDPPFTVTSRLEPTHCGAHELLLVTVERDLDDGDGHSMTLSATIGP